MNSPIAASPAAMREIWAAGVRELQDMLGLAAPSAHVLLRHLKQANGDTALALNAVLDSSSPVSARVIDDVPIAQEPTSGDSESATSEPGAAKLCEMRLMLAGMSLGHNAACISDDAINQCLNAIGGDTSAALNEVLDLLVLESGSSSTDENARLPVLAGPQSSSSCMPHGAIDSDDDGSDDGTPLRSAALDSHSTASWRVGERVEAKRIEPTQEWSSQWFPGIILAVHSDSTCDVKYCEGASEQACSDIAALPLHCVRYAKAEGKALATAAPLTAAQASAPHLSSAPRPPSPPAPPRQHPPDPASPAGASCPESSSLAPVVIDLVTPDKASPEGAPSEYMTPDEATPMVTRSTEAPDNEPGANAAGEKSVSSLHLPPCPGSFRAATSATSAGEPDGALPLEKDDASTSLRELSASFWGPPNKPGPTSSANVGFRNRFEGEDHELVVDEPHCGTGNTVGKEYDAFLPSVVSETGWCRIRALKPSLLFREGDDPTSATRRLSFDLTSEDSTHAKVVHDLSSLGCLPASYATEITKPTGLFATAAKKYADHVERWRALPVEQPLKTDGTPMYGQIGLTWAPADHHMRNSCVKRLEFELTEFEVTWPPEATGRKIKRAAPCALLSDNYKHVYADRTCWDIEEVMTRGHQRINPLGPSSILTHACVRADQCALHARLHHQVAIPPDDGRAIR